MHDRDDDQRAEAVIAELVAHRGTGCAACGARLCGHEVLFSRVLGFRAAPRCLECLASRLARNADALRNEARGYVLHQPCLRQGWEWSNADEGHAGATLPPCLQLPRAARPRAIRASTPNPQAPRGGGALPPVPPSPDASRTCAGWDAGEMGCGELVLELRLRLAELAPGAILEVEARDPGAREDLPAWCRMTGNTLLDARPPFYRIQRA